MSAAEAQKLIYELQVHQIELELQNEELMQSQQELELARGRYFELYDLAPVGYCTLSAQGLILEVNLTGAALLGLERKTLLNSFFARYIEAEDAENYHRRRWAVLQSGIPQAWELRLVRGDGTPFWTLLQMALSQDDAARPLFRLVFSDLTEVRRAQVLLREVSTAVDQSPVAIVITDTEGAIQFVNPMFTAMTGYSAEEVLGKNPRILQSGLVSPDVYQGLWNTLGAGKTWNGEFYNRKKNGELFWEKAVIAPVRDDRGVVISYVAIKEDITQRKRTEEALRASELKWRTLFDILPVGISLLDDQRLVTDFNHVLASILQLEPQQLRDGSYAKRNYLRADGSPLPPEQWPSVRAVREQVAIPAVEVGVQTEEGTVLWLQVGAAPLNIPGYSCVITTMDITERKQVEEDLRRSEQNLTKAQRFARVGSWTWNIKTNQLEWSEEMYRLFGIAQGTFSGDLAEVVATAIHPDDREVVAASNRAVAERGTPIPLEYRIVLPDGSTRYVWGEAGELVLDADGRPDSLSGIVQDITQRKAADQALRESEARFVSMAENSPAAFYRFSKRQGGIYYSTRIEVLLGFTAEELLANPLLWHDRIHPEDHPKVDAAIEAAMANLNGIDLVYRIRHKSGEEKWFKDTASCRLEADGDLVIDGVALDITERRQAEVALQESNQLLSLFIAQAPVYAYIKEVSAAQSLVLEASENFQQLIGIPGSAMVGKTMLELFPAEVAARMTADDWAVITSGVALEFEEELDGRKYVALKFPIIQGERKLLAGFSIDITERERANQIIADSREQLRVLLSRLQRVQEDERIRVSRIVHDELGQLLTELKLDLGWLERRLTEMGRVPELMLILDKVMGTSELVDTTIETVQRIAAELRPNTLETLGFEATLSQEARRFQEHSGIPCTLETEHVWPELGKETAVELFYICREALTNVARHAAAKGVKVSMRIESGVVVLEVCDDGIGMADQQSTEASSLGLLGMRERASQFGGTIAFEANQPCGTRVIVTIPWPNPIASGGAD